MGNAKIIIFILFTTFISCSINNNYFNEKGNSIKKPNGYHNIKYNLYKDAINNLYLECKYNIFYGGDGETIIMKSKGIYLQNSIEFLTELENLCEVIDTSTYEEIEASMLYKDKQYVYYNIGTEYAASYPSLPFVILDISPKHLQLLKGYYMKDDSVVYSYGGIHCVKIENVKAQDFNVIELKDTKY